MAAELHALLDALDILLHRVEIKEVDRDLITLVDGVLKDGHPCPSRQGGFKSKALALLNSGFHLLDHGESGFCHYRLALRQSLWFWVLSR